MERRCERGRKREKGGERRGKERKRGGRGRKGEWSEEERIGVDSFRFLGITILEMADGMPPNYGLNPIAAMFNIPR